MMKKMFIFAGLFIASYSYSMGPWSRVSERAQQIIKGLELQGVKLSGGSKTIDATSITYLGLMGEYSEAGVTCTKSNDSNQATCSTFENSAEGRRNFKQMSPEDANAWFEIFSSFEGPTNQ